MANQVAAAPMAVRIRMNAALRKMPYSGLLPSPPRVDYPENFPDGRDGDSAYYEACAHWLEKLAEKQAEYSDKAEATRSELLAMRTQRDVIREFLGTK